MRVTRRRFAFLCVLLVAVNSAFWLAQSAFGIGGGTVFQQMLGTRLVRAEVWWQSPAGFQDTRVDRGVIQSVTQDQIVLREKDGTTDSIPLAANATVTAGYRTATVAQLRRGMRVLVSRPATGSADTIVVEGLGQ